jgi:hypothetical protein
MLKVEWVTGISKRMLLEASPIVNYGDMQPMHSELASEILKCHVKTWNRENNARPDVWTGSRVITHDSLEGTAWPEAC